MSLSDIEPEVWPDPIDILIELAFGADLTATPDEWVWTDVSHLVKSNDGLNYRRGRPNESRQLNPSRFSFALDNDDGRFTPGNALSPHYPNVHRGVPIRFTLPGNMPPAKTLIADQFGRTFEDGWGIPDTGQEWLVVELFNDESGDFTVASVDGSAGVLTLSGTPGARAVMLQATSTVDADYRFTIGLNEVPTGTDEQVQFEMYVRTRYQFALQFRTDGSIWPRLDRADGPNQELGEIITTSTRARIVDYLDSGLSFTGSETYEVRMQSEGSTFRLRIWETGTAEPSDWLIEHMDNTYKAGMFGLGQWTGGDQTNDPLVWTYDNLVVTELEPPAVFLGQIIEWAPRWPEGDLGDYSRVQVVAGGILRQQAQRQKQARSTMYSTVFANPNPEDYWPAEDGATATQIANAKQGGQPATISGDVEMAATAPLPSTEPLPRLNDGSISGSVRSDSGIQSLVFLFDVPEGGLTNLGLIGRLKISGGFAETVEFRYRTGGNLRITATDENGTETETDTTGSPSWISMDGALHAFQLRLSIVSPGVSYAATLFKRRILADGTVLPIGDAITEDGRFLIVNNPPTPAIGQITSWTIGGGLGGGLVGHITYTGGGGFADFYEDLQPYTNPGVSGFIGESAVERFIRLCRDAEIPAVVNGSPAQSSLMGPQRPGRVIDLLQEAVAIDGGIMSELTTRLGLGYDGRHTLYNQEPALILDASAQPLREIRNPFQPILNDFDIVNDVTVTRREGSSARVIDQASVDAEGRYDERVVLNAAFDSQLEGLASWRLHLGTWPGMRYPQLSPDLGAVPTLIPTWVGLDLGDRVRVINLPSQHPAGAIDLLVQGTTDSITPDRWAASANMSPEGPYHIATVADPEEVGTGEDFSRIGSDGSFTLDGMRTDGADGNYASTPDHPSLDATQQVRLRVDMTLESYFTGSIMYLFGKYDFNADQRSFIIRILADGGVQVLLSSNGTGFEIANADARVPATNGQRIALQAEINVDSGTGDFTVAFASAPTIAGPFVPFGVIATGTLPGTSLFNSTAPVTVGAAGDGVTAAEGVFHGAEMEIEGAVVTNPEFEIQERGATSFEDEAGRTWTLNGTAETIGKFRAGVDTELIVSSRSQPWIYPADFATDFPFDIQMSGAVLRVTSTDGAAKIQTMTVDPVPVNGIEKLIPAGSEVQVANPVYIGL